jgi:pyruvate dehydrogenase E2 component (dihydrolipoamide acetyltransferase)
MAQTIIMPKLGQQTEESTIVKWHKKEGDPVRKGDVLFEMETDKAVLEAESFFDGTLLKIVVPEGVTVPVNAVVAFVGTPGEALPEAPAAPAAAAAAPAPAATQAVPAPAPPPRPPRPRRPRRGPRPARPRRRRPAGC